MSRTKKFSLHRLAGFGLVEIMVAMVIGMLAAIIMLQVFALSESRKRTTTSGGNAQSNGAIMFYQLQRDIGQAGYGFSSVGLFRCNATWTVASGSSIGTAIPLAPVTINPATSIIPAGDGNTDTLLIMYGNTNGEPQGNVINSQSGAVSNVQMPSAFAVNDRVIAAPAACSSNLTLDRITATSATTVTTATSAAGTTLYNLGPAPTVLAYAVRQGKLTVCDYMVNDCGISANTSNSSIWVPIASNIASMRAVYARDTSGTMDGIPDTPYDQTAPTTSCGVARISAIDLILVARSGQLEKEVVTTTAANAPKPVNAPTWAWSATVPIVATGGTLGPGTGTDEPWQHYRYKTFEGVVPIRNVAWMGVPTGC